MSLQLVAQHLAQKGRGPDSTLVHMSNKEVAGLQALAKKHGGELSVNPDTGLPEAGFLDNILPMVAGAGLTYISGGAIDPMTAGGIIGGITALDSKDLSKGLTAGLGAWGGAGMVGGLAGLGAAGADTAAMAAPEYQAAVGTGTGNFVNEPMTSLKTLGGGSALKGSLPILAGLAPAAAEAFDEEDEGDGAPEQKKGYIRKYALDPVTGQYKQVGVYEAGGDPNKDVSSEAGTAGAYGGVGQSEYQKAHGMADGGTTSSSSDSSRIYDYLMGRGPNPMQFTHTAAPAATVTPTPAPITPTTPILDQQYDEYGNPIKQNLKPGSSMDPESRAAMLADTAKRMDEWKARDPEGYAHRNDWIGNLLNNSTPALIAKGIRYVGEKISTAGVPEGQAGTLFGNVMTARDPSRWGSETGRTFSPTFGQTAENATLGNAWQNALVSNGDTTAALGEQNTNAGQAMQRALDSQQQSGQVSNDPQATARDNASLGIGPDNDRGDADNGGPSMARGGISGQLRPPQPFYANGKFSYKGPQVYADGGIAALAQRYDDGGMTLPLKAQPINNLGSMHPKSLQAAYDHAVATNDVAGARKYQNELGLRSKLQNAKIYAGGGETGEYNLGSYSDGGRLLKGPGDGVSDDIPATIGHGQPARLADGEFVIPARIVSEIGNGSTDAGARELYKMMDRVQAGRRKTVGKDQVATNTKAVRHLPA